jgi:hypothetical protein
MHIKSLPPEHPEPSTKTIIMTCSIGYMRRIWPSGYNSGLIAASR